MQAAFWDTTGALSPLNDRLWGRMTWRPLPLGHRKEGNEKERFFLDRKHLSCQRLAKNVTWEKRCFCEKPQCDYHAWNIFRACLRKRATVCHSRLISGSVLRAHRLLSESAACCPNPHAQQGVSLFFSCLMKYLDAETLNLLDRTWSDWLEKARTLKQRRIRLRLYFVYLLIRHGGLRLGEALEIDDKKDLIFSTSTIHVADVRDIQIPDQAMASLLRIAEDPAVSDLLGSLSHVDPGYVRKNFYLVADMCGIDKSLGGPRVLRHSRGAELLNNGIPVSIVQKFLGLQSPAQAVQLNDFQDSEARQILHAHLRRETLRHSSARNAFAGSITAIREGMTTALVVVSSLSGLEIRATVSMESMRTLSLHKGQTVTATVKAPWVVLTREGSETSLGNNYTGTVLYVREGEIEASVRIRLDDGTGMAALMGMEAVRRMEIGEGTRCSVSFSSMAVALLPG